MSVQMLKPGSVVSIIVSISQLDTPYSLHDYFALHFNPGNFIDSFSFNTLHWYATFWLHLRYLCAECLEVYHG